MKDNSINRKKQKSKKIVIRKALSLMILLSATLLSLFMLSSCECSHEWLEATCTEPQVCEKCGETQGEALGHSWLEATCTEPKHCERCGEEQGEPLDHTPGEWVVVTPATCTEPGEQENTCSVCGETITEEIEPLGHQLGEWEIGTEATAQSSGEKIQKCTVCGEIINRDTYYLTTEEIAAAEQAAEQAIEQAAAEQASNSVSISITKVDQRDGSPYVYIYYQCKNTTNSDISKLRIRATLYDSSGNALTSQTDSVSNILAQQFRETFILMTCSTPFASYSIEPIEVEFDN